MKWNAESYWLKAKLYIDRANDCGHESPDYALWCSLALELLARAALTKVHPVLNADPREDTNLLYACGFPITGQPKSLPAHAVFLRLEKTVPDFGRVQRELCDYIALLRNEEIHSSSLAFENIQESKWLPRYYEVCRVLCVHLGKSLDDFVGIEVGKAAAKLIAALAVGLESAVKSRIAAHRKVFESKPAIEQEKLKQMAMGQMKLLPYGHTSEVCPACGSRGLLKGELIKELKPVYEDESLLIDQEFLAIEFRCTACELTLGNPEELAHTSIEPRFTKRRQTSLHELFEPDVGPEYENM